jgi:epoxyqueuosine reductase
MNLLAQQRRQRLQTLALELGFLDCKVAQARRLDEESQRLENWLQQGNHGEMGYMERHFEERLDPRRLLAGCRSVVVLLHNYYQEVPPSDSPKIAMYAQGEDYHRVLKDKMRVLVQRMREEFGEFNVRIFTDSAPILEKSWAALAGAGWVGKNTNLLQKQSGSYFFLAEILCDLEFTYDHPVKDHCGDCNRCVDACPTGALEPYRLDARRCLSYLTIELRNQIPESFEGQSEGWAFGCDICQEVCPWNRFSTTHKEPRFDPLTPSFPTAQEWLNMSEEEFKTMFQHSPIARAGLQNMQRNVRFVLGLGPT